MNEARLIPLLFVLVAGCPATTDTDAGRDVPLGDVPTVGDVSRIDTPIADAPVDAPGVSDAAVDAPPFDAGECLAAGSDCSRSGPLPCCGPSMCIPTGGDGAFRCVDETGCVPLAAPCGPSDVCCGGNYCGEGVCMTPA